MVASTHFADADATSNITDGLTDPGGGETFVAGELKESTDETSGITLGTEFTEIEYALTATNAAIGGGTYCFRLTDAWWCKPVCPRPNTCNCWTGYHNPYPRVY